MDGEEKPELEEEIESKPAEEMEAIPRGCMLAVWWLALLVVLGFLVEFALHVFGILK